MPAHAPVRLRLLHAVARLALRVLPPTKARDVVDEVARLLRPFPSASDALSGLTSLGTTGSCLTRVVTISALLPGSDVAIGVDPRRSARLHAHAWVELNGRPIGDTETSGTAGLEPVGRFGARRA